MGKEYITENTNELGTVDYTCNSSASGGQGGSIAQGQEFETSVDNIARTCLYKKIQKLDECGCVCL